MWGNACKHPMQYLLTPSGTWKCEDILSRSFSLCHTLQDLINISEDPFVMYWQCSSHITSCCVLLLLLINCNTIPEITYTTHGIPYGWQSYTSTQRVPVNAEFHVPITLSLKKEVLISIVQENGGLQGRSGSFREETNLTPLPGIETWHVGCPAIYLFTVSTEVPCNPYVVNYC